jgi:fructose-bisphosphate aldolase class 1
MGSCALGDLEGLEVETGLQLIYGMDEETSTQGLDGLADRCKK